MLVTYSIFKLQVKIPFVCLKVSLFLCKEEETNQMSLKVGRIDTGTNQKNQAELLKGNVNGNLYSVLNVPCQGIEDAGGTDKAVV